MNSTDYGRSIMDSTDGGQVVDSGASSRYVPIHHCRRSGTATDPCSAADDFMSLGDCQGSCSNFDDDWVSNISPGDRTNSIQLLLIQFNF